MLMSVFAVIRRSSNIGTFSHDRHSCNTELLPFWSEKKQK